MQRIRENWIETFFGVIGFVFVIDGFIADDWRGYTRGIICFILIVSIRIKKIEKLIKK